MLINWDHKDVYDDDDVRGMYRPWNNPDEVVYYVLTLCLPSDPNAMALTWLEVSREKLLEPVVRVVSQ